FAVVGGGQGRIDGTVQGQRLNVFPNFHGKVKGGDVGTSVRAIRYFACDRHGVQLGTVDSQLGAFFNVQSDRSRGSAVRSRDFQCTTGDFVEAGNGARAQVGYVISEGILIDLGSALELGSINRAVVGGAFVVDVDDFD